MQWKRTVYLTRSMRRRRKPRPAVLVGRCNCCGADGQYGNCEKCGSMLSPYTVPETKVA